MHFFHAMSVFQIPPQSKKTALWFSNSTATLALWKKLHHIVFYRFLQFSKHPSKTPSINSGVLLRSWWLDWLPDERVRLKIDLSNYTANSSLSWFFSALSIYIILLLHPLQEALKSTYKEMCVNTKYYLNCSVMYIHLLFWNKVYILYFNCNCITTAALTS